MAETKENCKVGLIFKKIPAIMAEVPSIAKDRKNPQGYFFRGVDDVYLALHELLAKHRVFTVPEVLSEESQMKASKAGSIAIYRILKIKYTFYAEDGSYISATVIGEGADYSDKAANKAMSVAHKYALLQVFCIPTNDPKDPEVDSPQVGDFRSDMGGSSDPFMGTDTPDSKPESPREKTGKIEKTKPPEEDDKEKYRTIPLILSNGFKKMVSKFEALDYFQKLKGVLGELSYYAILAQDGHKSSKDIPPQTMPEVYTKLIEAYEFAKSTAKENSPQQGDGDEPVF